jgi:hypothetical protein
MGDGKIARFPIELEADILQPILVIPFRKILILRSEAVMGMTIDNSVPSILAYVGTFTPCLVANSSNFALSSMACS